MPNKDTRVVDMQFQNEQFEKNIATSQKSLSRFKKELNFDETSKGLEKFGQSVDALKFDKFFDNIQRLTDKFTGIGNIGEFVVSRIRSSLEQAADSALRFSKSLTFDQIDEGMNKFEQLNKSIRTIMAATGDSEEKVSEIMQRLNLYTDWTSYSFGDMAQNIGKFTSVGIPLEQAERQMEGIANWAARSGAGIQEASRAMYNLSQAMGVGKLKLIDWKSIENAGMATKEFKEQMIQAGVAAGTIEKTVKKGANGVEQTVYKTSKKLGKQVTVDYTNFSETLNKGWATKDVLGNTLSAYYYEDLTGELEDSMIKLTDEQKKMFEGFVKETGQLNEEAWKQIEEQGLGGDEIKQKLLDTAVAFGTLTEEVDEAGNKIYITTDKAGKEIKFTFDEFEKGLKGKWLTKNVANLTYQFDSLAKSSYKSAQECKTFSDVIQAWKDQMSTGWMNSLQHIFGGLTDSVNMFSQMCNKVGDELNEIFGTDGVLNKILGIWEVNGGRDSLWSLIIGSGYTDAAGNQIYEDAYGIIDILIDVKDMIADAFWDVMKVFAEGYLPEEDLLGWDESPELRFQFIAYRIQDITESIRGFITSVRNFFAEIPEGASKSRWEMIRDVIQAVFHAIRFAAQVVGGIFTFFRKIKDQLGPSIEAISDLLYSLAIGFSDAESDLNKSNGIQTFFSNFAETLKPVTDFINRVVTGVVRLIRAFIKWGTEGGHFLKIWNLIKDVFEGIIKIFDKIAGPFLDFLRDIGPAIGDFFSKGISKETISNFVESFGKAIVNMFGTFGSYIPAIWKKVKEAFSTLFKYVEEFIGADHPGILGAIIQMIKNIVGGAVDFIKNLGSSLGGDDTVFGVLKRIIGGDLTTVGEYAKKIKDALSGVCLYDIIMGFLGGFAIYTALGLVSGVISIVKGFGKILKSISWIFGAISERIADPGEKALKYAKAIAIIAAAIFVLGQMKIDQAAIGVGAVVAAVATMLGGIWLLGKIISKMRIRDIFKIKYIIESMSSAILKVSIGVFVMVKALEPLVNYNWSQLSKMAAGLIGILTILTIFVEICKVAKLDNKLMKGIGRLGLGIGILLFALKPLADMNWDQMGRMGVGLAGVLLMLALFSHIAGSIKGKGIGQVAFLALGIAILIASLKPLVNMDWQQMEKMGIALSAVLVMLAGFSHIVGSFKGTHMKSTIALALSIVLLMESLKPLANYDWESLGKMGAGLAVVLALLTRFSKKTAGFKGTHMRSTIALAIGIWLLMESLKPLAKYDWESLGKIGAGLGVVLLMLAEFTKHVKSLKFKGMANTITLAAGIYLLMEAVKPLANYDWESLGKISAGLAVITLILVKFTKNVKSLKFKSIGSLILYAASIYLLIEAVKPLANYDWESLGKISAGLAVITLILVKFTKNVKSLKFKSTGSLILYAASIYLLIKALEPLANYSWESLAKMGSGLLAISSVMIVVSKKLGKIKIKDVLGLVVFCGNIYLLIKALEPLANYSWESLAKMGAGLYGCIIAFAISVKVMEKMDWKSAIASFAPMLGISVMISIFGKSLEKVKDIDATKILAFSGSVVVLSIALAIVMKSINSLNSSSSWSEIGGKLAMAGVALISVGALIAELALFADKISNADILKIMGFVVAVDLLMPSLYIAALAVNKLMLASGFTGTKIGHIALVMAVFITIGGLIAELALLSSTINNADILKIMGFVVAIDLLMPALYIAAIAINKIDTFKMYGAVGGKIALVAITFIAVGALIAELALLSSTISNSDVLKIIGFVVAIDLLMPSLFVAAIAISQLMMGSAFTGTKTSQFAIVATVFIAVGGLMAELALLSSTINNADILKIMGFVVAVDLLMPSLYIAALAVNKIQTFGSTNSIIGHIALAAVAFIAVGGLMAELALLSSTISNADVISILGFVIAVDALMPALYIAALATDKITMYGTTNAIVGKIALATVVFIAVGGLMAELAALSSTISNADTPKIMEFVAAVDLLMPALYIAALAVNKIKSPGTTTAIIGKVTLMVTTLISVGALLAELAYFADNISDADVIKIVEFSIAVDVLMPALYIAAIAVNKIKVPSTGKEIVGKIALMFSTIIAVGVLLFELAAMIPLINKGDIDRIGAFVISVDLLTPALYLATLAINNLKTPMGKNRKGEESSSIKALIGKILLTFSAIIAVGVLMGELAMLVPSINKAQLDKLIGFVVAVELLVPSLITVVTAINKIKIPTVSNSRTKEKTKGIGKKADSSTETKSSERTAGLRGLSSLMSIITAAVLVVGAIMLELALIIPLIDKMENGLSLAKLGTFVASVDLLIPALIGVVNAINKIKVPTSASNKSTTKSHNWSSMTGKKKYNNQEKDKGKEGTSNLSGLSGLMGIIAAAVLTMSVIMWELAAIIHFGWLDDMDDWAETSAKLGAFVGAINLLIPALVGIVKAINAIKIPTITTTSGASTSDTSTLFKKLSKKKSSKTDLTDTKDAGFKDLSGLFAIIFAAVFVVSAIMWQLGVIIHLGWLDEMDDWAKSSAKLGAFVAAVDLIMPALYEAVIAINKIDLSIGSKDNKHIMTGKEAFKKILLLIGAIAAMAAVMFLMSRMIDEIDIMDDWAKSSGKLIGFAFAVDAIMPALILAVIALNQIKGDMNFKTAFKKTTLLMGAVMAMAGIMWVLSLLISEIDKMDDWAKSSAKLIGFSLAIDAIMPALILSAKALGSIKGVTVNTKLSTIWKKLLIFGAAFAAVAGLMLLMSALIPSINNADVLKMIGFSVSIVPLVFAIALMTKTITGIDVPKKKEELTGKLKILGIAAAAVAVLAVALGFAVSLFKNADPIAMLSFATSIALVTGAVVAVAYAITKIKLPANDKGSNKNSKLNNRFKVLAASILAIGAVMIALAWSIDHFNIDRINPLSMMSFAVSLDIILGAVIAVDYAISKFEAPDRNNKNKNTQLRDRFKALAAAVIAIGVLMIGFAWAIDQFNIDAIGPLEMLSFAGSVVVLSLALSMMLKSISKINADAGNNFFKKIKVLALALASVGVLMLVLSEVIEGAKGMDPLETLAFSASVIVLSLALSVTLKAISKIEDDAAKGFFKKLKVLILAIGSMAALMYIFGSVLHYTKDIDPVSMIAFSASMIILMVSMALIINVIENMKAPKGNWGGKIVTLILSLVVIVIAAQVLGKSLKNLKDIKWEAMLAFAAGIGLVMLLMAAAIKILEHVDVAAGEKAVLILASALTALGVVVDIIGPLIGNGLSEMLIELGNGLHQFGIMIEPFVYIMERIDTGVIFHKMEDILDIAKLGGEAGQYGKAITSFGTAINGLSSNLSAFANRTSGMPDDPSQMNAFKFIDKICEYNQKFSDFNTFGFGYKLHNLGSGLSGFMTTTSDITQKPEDLPAMQLLMAFADHANDIQTLVNLSGGLATLSGELSTLGGALVIYGDAAHGVDLTDLTEEELKSIQDPNKVIGVLQAVIDTFTGENGVTLPTLPDSDTIDQTFAPSLVALGGAVKKFGEACQGIDNEKVGKGLEAIGYIAQIHHELIKDQVEGSTALEGLNVFKNNGQNLFTIGMFGTDLIALADGLQHFINACSGIDTKTSLGLAAIGFLYDIHDKLTEKDLLKKSMKLFSSEEGTDTSVLQQFGSDILILGDNLADFADKVNFTNDGKARNFRRALKSLDFLTDIAGRLDKIKTDTSVWATIFHKEEGMDLGQLGGQLSVIGRDLGNFYSQTVGAFEQNGGGSFDPEKITKVFGTLTAVIEAGKSALGYVEGEEWDAFVKRTDGVTSAVYAFDNIALFLEKLVTGDIKRDGDEAISVAAGIGQFLWDFDNALYTSADGKREELHIKESADILKAAGEGISAFLHAAAYFGSKDAEPMKLDQGFIEVGTTLCASIVRGIKNGTWSVLEAISSLVDQAQAAGMDELTIGDVAEDLADFVKTFDEELFGGPDGLKNENTPQILRDTAEAVNFLVSAINSLSTVETPTIGPVIDLTDLTEFQRKTAMLEGGMKGLAEIGANYTMTLKLDAGQFEQLAPKDYTASFTSLLEKMDSLQSEVKDLGNDISRMKVVMDTGALVGSIGGNVEEYINRNGFYSSRLN